MSKGGKKIININRNSFTDRRIEENESFSELTIRMDTIDTVLLLFDSEEAMVLINALKHIVEYVRRNDENIMLLKEKNVLQLLLQKELFCRNSSVMVKRLSLYLASFIIEKILLVELEFYKICEIVQLSLSFYLKETDDFCCEYLSVILNKCLDDPQCADAILDNSSFVMKYFSTIAATTNPDVLLHSLELLHKILLVQSAEGKYNFITLELFPINRLLCELNCEYFEIRKAALKVIQSLILDAREKNIFNNVTRATFLLQELTKIFSQSSITEEMNLVVAVLASAMEHDFIISLFFELNLFDKYLNHINSESMENKMICKALWVFAECAKLEKYVPRLVSSNITEKLLDCLLNGDNNPAAHILLGLNRLMKSPIASQCVTDACDLGLLPKILKILLEKDTVIKAREQAANLLENLLSTAFHKTSSMILSINFTGVVAEIFAQAPEYRSIDLVLSLLNALEIMAANSDYRADICTNDLLITNIGFLLKNSFSTAILVTHLFRCLCSLVEEERVHELISQCSLYSSIKRALQSPSNQVRTAATNFIMQTTRFPTFVTAYKDAGILEVLLLYQKHAFCVPTWKPAIESILSKHLTMKFCIRNSLGFTDITAGTDFMVSKKKFEDFRVFQCILKEEVSPLYPVIVVNFNRREDPEDLVVKVPSTCFLSSDFNRSSLPKVWCYCRSPGDEFLPLYLEEVNTILESQNLAINPIKIPKSIDFDNLAKRARVIAQVVDRALGHDLKLLDLHTTEECSNLTVKCHLKELSKELHCTYIPLGRIRSGCKFERAILFKALADQVGLPCTLQRSVDGRILFNELPLPLELEQDIHCEKQTLSFMPWRMLRPTHIIDLMYNVGELYPLQSRQAFQYLRLY